MTDVRIKTTENVSKIIKIGKPGPPGIGLNVIAATITPVINELIFTMGDYSTISAGIVNDGDEIRFVDQVGDKLVFTLENGVTITSSTISHNLLSSLQGGTVSQYYHLNNSLYGIVSSLSVSGGKLLYNNSTLGITDHTLLDNLNSSTYSHITSTIASIVSSLSVVDNKLQFNGGVIGVTEASQLSFTPTLGITATNSQKAIEETNTLNTGDQTATTLPTTPFDDIASTNQQATNEEIAGKRVKVAQGFINGQKGTRIPAITPNVDGSTYAVDLSLGNTVTITPTDAAGFDYVLNFTNVPVAAEFSFLLTLRTVVGVNLPTVAYQINGVSKSVTAPTFTASKNNRWLLEFNAAGGIDVNAAGVF